MWKSEQISSATVGKCRGKGESRRLARDIFVRPTTHSDERTTGRCHAADISAHVRGLHLTGSKNQWPLPAAKYVVIIRQRITGDARRCILLRASSRTGKSRRSPHDSSRGDVARVARAMTRTAHRASTTRGTGVEWGGEGEQERENAEREEKMAAARRGCSSDGGASVRRPNSGTRWKPAGQPPPFDTTARRFSSCPLAVHDGCGRAGASFLARASRSTNWAENEKTTRVTEGERGRAVGLVSREKKKKQTRRWRR